MVELRHVRVQQQGRTILLDVNFEVARGEFVYLLGPMGAGKSTLLKLILFEERPDEGAVFVGDYDSGSIREKDIPFLRRRVGVLFQDFRLLADRTVFENVAFALEVTGVPRKKLKRRTLTLLSAMDLVHKRDAYPVNLSGGEQQCVALARALANDPFVLLVDEPTANLDRDTTDLVMKTLGDANARGTAILMATHDVSLVERFRRRTLEIDGGRVVDRK